MMQSQLHFIPRPLVMEELAVKRMENTCQYITEAKPRKRSIANMMLLGELYKLQLVPLSTIHECVNQLLKTTEYSSLKCLYRLLIIVGKDLEREKEQLKSLEDSCIFLISEHYLDQIKKMLNHEKTSLTSRLILKDILHLWLNNWESPNQIKKESDLQLCVPHLQNDTTLTTTDLQQEKLKQFQEPLAEERKKRLAERKKQRKVERRKAFYLQKDEEAQRIHEEQLKKERDERERLEQEQRQKEGHENQERLHKLEKEERKQLEQQQEIEERERCKEEERRTPEEKPSKNNRKCVPHMQNDTTLTTTDLQQVAQSYQSIEFTRLSSVVPFDDAFQLERSIVDTARHGDLQVRIDHTSRTLRFGSDLNYSTKEDMPSDEMQNQLIAISSSLAKAIQLIKPASIRQEREEQRQQAIAAYRKNAQQEHQRILARRQAIEERLERLEQREKEKLEQREAKLQKVRKAEEERLRQEAKEREKVRNIQEHERIKKRIVRDRLEQIKKTELGAKAFKNIDIEDLEEPDIDLIMAKQVEKEKKKLQEHLKNQEKKIDHLERAKRLEEIPLIKKAYEEKRIKDMELWELQEEERISNIKREKAQRMMEDKEKFLSKIKAARSFIYEEKVKQFQERLAEERKKRLEERKKLRKEGRRKAFYLQKKEEAQRIREEQLKKERDERLEQEQREKEERENQERLRKLEEEERKQLAQQQDTILRPLQQVAQSYQSIEFTRLSSLVPFVDAFQLERSIVDAARHCDLQIDHFERAKRLEEIPLIKKAYEEKRIKDMELWELQEEERISNMKREKAQRMMEDKEKFLSKIYEKKLKQFQERFVEEKKKRLEERKKQRKEDRRKAFYLQKKEEAQRIRGEQLKKERDERERLEQEQREKEERENQERLSKLEEEERKQLEQQQEIEERERCKEEERRTPEGKPSEDWSEKEEGGWRMCGEGESEWRRPVANSNWHQKGREDNERDDHDRKLPFRTEGDEGERGEKEKSSRRGGSERGFGPHQEGDMGRRPRQGFDEECMPRRGFANDCGDKRSEEDHGPSIVEDRGPRRGDDDRGPRRSFDDDRGLCHGMADSRGPRRGSDDDWGPRKGGDDERGSHRDMEDSGPPCGDDSRPGASNSFLGEGWVRRNVTMCGLNLFLCFVKIIVHEIID